MPYFAFTVDFPRKKNKNKMAVIILLQCMMDNKLAYYSKLL